MITLSLTCITTIDHANAVRAINTTAETLYSAGVPLNLTYWFSDKPIPSPTICPVMWHQVPTFEKHNWMTLYNVHALVNCPIVVQTDYNLIVQSDGFAINPDAWTDEFLDYDYIGAVWPWYRTKYRVGNGGFSLRSKKLYEALREIKYDRVMKYSDFKGHASYEEDAINIPDLDDKIIPEDALICRYLRDALETSFDIKFCPEDLASRFSIEDSTHSTWIGKSFGFHGKRYIRSAL